MISTTFAKMHGLGNDFVIIDGIINPDVVINSNIASKLSHRRYGIGADQVLYLSKGENEEFNYRIWNADGSEVMQCGNGARCAHAYLHLQRYTADKSKLRTSSGLIEVETTGDNCHRAHLGIPKFEPSEIPLNASSQSNTYKFEHANETLEFKALSIGNPHALITVNEFTDVNIEVIGAAFNSSKDFPEGVNVSFAKKINDKQYELHVYERGVGVTPACGSAVGALAVTAGLNGVTQIDVTLTGGKLKAGWDGPNTSTWIEGEISYVYNGEIELKL